MPKDHTTPVLFIIDETHTFYDSRTSQDALNDLSVVCRTGRQYKTAIIFASQSPRDIPQDLESVVATKIFFQSERKDASGFGLSADGILATLLFLSFGEFLLTQEHKFAIPQRHS